MIHFFIQFCPLDSQISVFHGDHKVAFDFLRRNGTTFAGLSEVFGFMGLQADSTPEAGREWKILMKLRYKDENRKIANSPLVAKTATPFGFAVGQFMSR